MILSSLQDKQDAHASVGKVQVLHYDVDSRLGSRVGALHTTISGGMISVV